MENNELVNPETVEETGIKETDTDNGKESPKNYPTQTVLTIRAIVGGYVMYLAYQIITSDSTKSPWMWAAVAVLLIAGALLVIMSVKHFISGEYEGGKKDENR